MIIQKKTRIGKSSPAVPADPENMLWQPCLQGSPSNTHDHHKANKEAGGVCVEGGWVISIHNTDVVMINDKLAGLHPIWGAVVACNHRRQAPIARPLRRTIITTKERETLRTHLVIA